MKFQEKPKVVMVNGKAIYCYYPHVLAYSLGVTTRTLRNYLKKGLIPQSNLMLKLGSSSVHAKLYSTYLIKRVKVIRDKYGRSFDIKSAHVQADLVKAFNNERRLYNL
ncbi:MerR family transcriptional regulator [Flammeovirga agarivorans]|uniref:Uncharacterized protein n=1 Tax=Flammeovirga agarivorans TaxID=2726742 RepID=A0A7X8XZ92_9BACT|nr:hypothetical protein [Flammeovirga agarivorans]NLR94937.1 hypothetical protein [Flammeovirga agarivorans]